jgi:hypothetical protein
MPVQDILLTNPHDHPLQEICVVIERNAFRQKDDSLHPLIYDKEKTRILPVQVDDLDDDGSWDEAAFLVSLNPGETFRGRIEWQRLEEIPAFPVRTNVYLGISRKRNGHFTEVRKEVFPPDYECHTPYQYQFEGVGWENDMIAFRTYCDRRNGKDIFGKTTSEMVLTNVGKIDNYHKQQSWGMDILKVGNSLGIGAVGAVKNGKLYRLGDTRYHDFQILAEGPVRSIFKLGFDGWVVAGDTLSATETITITAGQNGFLNRFEVSGNNVPDTLVAGLSMIGIEGDPENFSNQDWPGIRLSGINDLDDRFLGMAVFTSNSRGFSTGATPKASEIYDVKNPEYQAIKFHPYISDTYYLTTAGPVADFYVFTLWEGRYPEIHTPEIFHQKVNRELLPFIHVPEVVLR